MNKYGKISCCLKRPGTSAPPVTTVRGYRSAPSIRCALLCICLALSDAPGISGEPQAADSEALCEIVAWDRLSALGNVTINHRVRVLLVAEIRPAGRADMPARWVWIRYVRATGETDHLPELIAAGRRWRLRLRRDPTGDDALPAGDGADDRRHFFQTVPPDRRPDLPWGRIIPCYVLCNKGIVGSIALPAVPSFGEVDAMEVYR